jgi:hypothetical protein
MPPKPTVFKTPDGKEFNTRAEWRDYMMLTFYSFKNKHNEPEPLIKAPGSIEGQMFDIGDCTNSTLVVLDHSEQVQIDNLENCRVWISACASSIFIRNCKNCTFYTCCRQLRLRDVIDSKFYTFSMSEVHIETSNGLKFGPFNGGYPDHARHLASANLNIAQNLWYDIYDHNDPAKTNSNWSLIPESEYEAAWFPAGPCEPAIPRTKAGSVAKVEDAGMQSFGLQQMRSDAQKVPSPVKPTAAAVVPPAAPTPEVAAAPAPASASSSGVAVVAPTPVAESILNDDAVLKLITAYVSAQAGTSLSGIVDDFHLDFGQWITCQQDRCGIVSPNISSYYFHF